ncbi:MAG: DUF4328 domain-containing protein [Actinomycetota bacterium]
MTNADGSGSAPTAPTAAAATSPRRRRLSLHPLGWAPMVARWALALFLGATVAMVVLGITRIAELSDERASTPIAEVPDRFVDVRGALAALAAVTFVLTAVAWIVALWRMAKNGGEIWPSRARLGSIWAVVGWVIPVASVVLPYLVTVQTWDTSRSRREVRDYERAPGYVLPWWIGWVLLTVVDRGRGAVLGEPSTQGDLLRQEQVDLVVGIGYLLIGALFLALQRALVRRHEEAIADPWDAPVLSSRR